MCKFTFFSFCRYMFMFMSLISMLFSLENIETLENGFDNNQVRKPRNIYLDLGAFNGDTLQMYQLNNVQDRAYPETPWEVFAFEACPLLAHNVQMTVDKLNGESQFSPLTYNDVRGMQKAVEYAYKFKTSFDFRLEKLFKKYEALLVARKSTKGSFQELLDRNLEDVLRDLYEVNAPENNQIKTCFRSFPVGVGIEDSYMFMNWAYSNYMNGGGNVLDIDYGIPSHVFRVPIIKLSRWIKDKFSKEDYIYIKMDIEGMEFLLLQDLISEGCLDYIKEMDVEWHGRFNVPGREHEKQLKEIIISKGILLRDHY